METNLDSESIRRQFGSEFESIPARSRRITIPANLASIYADMLNVETLGIPAGSRLFCRQETPMVTIDVNRNLIASMVIEESKRRRARGSSVEGLSSFSSKSHGGLDDLNFCYDMREKMNAKGIRNGRKSDARRIPRPLTRGYNSNMNQKIACIWSGGSHFLTEALSGISWVAVHGIDSICVVTRIKDLELEFSLRMAMLNFEPEHLLHMFTHGLIGKVEDFVDPSCRKYQLIQTIIKKPFGIVSVAPHTKIVRTVSGHKASSDEYDEGNAIKFLQKEMERGMAFTFDETVQTTISALNHLFNKRFNANEIMVFVWKKDMCGGQAKALPHFREELDISGHLAAINNLDSCFMEQSSKIMDTLMNDFRSHTSVLVLNFGHFGIVVSDSRSTNRWGRVSGIKADKSYCLYPNVWVTGSGFETGMFFIELRLPELLGKYPKANSMGQLAEFIAYHCQEHLNTDSLRVELLLIGCLGSDRIENYRIKMEGGFYSARIDPFYSGGGTGAFMLYLFFIVRALQGFNPDMSQRDARDASDFALSALCFAIKRDWSSGGEIDMVILLPGQEDITLKCSPQNITFRDLDL